jgi:hypothetical protein
MKNFQKRFLNIFRRSFADNISNSSNNQQKSKINFNAQDQQNPNKIQHQSLADRPYVEDMGYIDKAYKVAQDKTAPNLDDANKQAAGLDEANKPGTGKSNVENLKRDQIDITQNENINQNTKK